MYIMYFLKKYTHIKFTKKSHTFYFNYENYLNRMAFMSRSSYVDNKKTQNVL